MQLHQERDRLVSSGVTWRLGVLVGASAVFVMLAWQLTLVWQGALASPGSAVVGKDAAPGIEEPPTLIEYAAPGLFQSHQQRESLERFAWVSQKEGLVRIPISVAMSLYLDRQGSPQAIDFDPPPPSSTGAQ